MRRDNETTAVQLHSLLVSLGYTLSQYYFALQAIVGLEAPRKHILPTYTKGQQKNELPGQGSTLVMMFLK